MITPCSTPPCSPPAGGFTIENPKDFASRIYSLLGGGEAAAGGAGGSSGSEEKKEGVKQVDAEVV